MVTSASHVGTGSDQDQDKNGIAYRHAYTIVAAAELEDGTKLLRVRNPWGSEMYHGPFSDDSDTWENYPGFEYVKKNDGQWWIDAKSYHEGMSQTTGNPDVQDEHMTYYALFEVEGVHEERITFKSDVDQTVYISAYTYDSQHIRNGQCDDHSEGSYFYFRHDKSDDWLYPMYGYSHHMPYEMKAGETLGATLQAFWAATDLTAHDLSVVVQAEKSPVTIQMEHDHESSSFPNFTLSDSVKIEPMRKRDRSGGDEEKDPEEEEKDPEEEEKVPEEEEKEEDTSPVFDPSIFHLYTESTEDVFRQGF